MVFLEFDGCSLTLDLYLSLEESPGAPARIICEQRQNLETAEWRDLLTLSQLNKYTVTSVNQLYPIQCSCVGLY